MSKPLIVVLPHSLGKEEALRRLRPSLSKAAASFPVLQVEEEVWSGDQLQFRVRALGQAASGTVEVRDTDLRLEVMLPWFLEKFAQTVEKVVRTRGSLMIEKKPSAS
ncbi:MAG: polyhydroxyalkanoic acid system family protein [Hyphomicrobiaceae bacterium]|nr:polyhydroxyalkanoic acid system family protein [Hyphomicrobiaceae bacterium]